MRKEITELWSLVEPHVRGAGLGLVELEFGREAGGWVVRVFVDRDDEAEGQGAGVSHEDCERVSRDLSAALDVADKISHAYRLEVSSPGIARPLRRERDFRRFKGQQVRIRTADPVDGRRNFSGTLDGAQDGLVNVECEGRRYVIPTAGIVRASLVPDWAAEFKKADRSAS